MKKYIFITILFLTMGFCAKAQIIIKGLITDGTNNQPLIGAIVSINNLNLFAVADIDGSYELIVATPSEAKDIVLSANILGFKENQIVVELLPIDDGDAITKDFIMEIDPLTLGNVIVTANKVEEEMQNVPIAISVLDAKNLESRTVSTAEEAFEVIPNFTFDGQNPGRPTISLRGLATLPGNAGIENSVGLYIDDVFQSRSYGFNSTLMDIQRVEVLRGPQGTLFGKNTVGGLLHIVTEKPKFANSGSLEFNAGNYNYFQVRGKGNTVLIKNKLAVRFTAAYKKRDGWLNESNEEVADENGTTFYGGRLSLRFKPNEKIDWIMRSSYSHDDRADFTIDYRTPANGIDRFSLSDKEKDHTDRKVSQNETSREFKRTDINWSNHVNVKLNKILTLTSVTSYTNFDNNFIRDFDATSEDVAILGRGADVSSFSQDLRIATPRENRKLFFIGGLYFLKDKVTNYDTLALKGKMADVWKLILNPNLPINEDNYKEHTTINSDITSTSYAAYLSGSYEITERIRFNAGMRYTNEKKEINFVQKPVSPFPFNLIGTAVTAPLDTMRSTTDNIVSGNFGMDFKTTDNILIYLNFSRGFKGSGFNITFTPDTDPAKAAFLFKPEIANSYEVGLKIKSRNRFLFNAALFVTDFKNKQELVAAGTSIFVSTARSIQGQGIEGEFVGIWNQYFKTSASFGALNLKYLDFPFINPNTGEALNLSGNKALKAPGFTFKFAPELRFPLGKELMVLMRADYNYVGKAYNDIFNSEHLARQSAGRINARLSFSTKNNRYSISIWGKNLTDELYFQHAWSFAFGDHVSLNPPRMVGIELRANFY